jgi:hypothetical protein
MSENEQDAGHVRLHGEEPSVESKLVFEEHTNDIFVVVTQLYCHNGHNMVTSKELFDGFPGISLWLEGGGAQGEIAISPVHGDLTKRGVEFPSGTKVSILCPTCKEELPELTNCRCSDHGKLRKAFLTPKLSEAHIIAVCDMWGCPLSRVIDSYEMFTEFLEGRIGDLPASE